MPDYKGSFSYDTCPSCKEQMEHGYIVSNLRLNWCDHVPTTFCKCGELLARNLLWGCASLEGYRCRKCQIIRYITK